MAANTDLILEAGGIGGRGQDRLRQLRADEQSTALNELKLGEARETAESKARLRAIAPSFLNAQGGIDNSALARYQAGEGDIEGLQKTAQSQAAIGASAARQQGAELRAKREQLQLHSDKLNAANQAISQATDEQSYQRVLAEAQNNPMLEGADFSDYPEHFDNVAINRIQMKLLKAKDQIDIAMKQEEREDARGRFQQREARMSGQFAEGQAGLFARANAANAARLQAAGISAGAGSIQPLSEEERRTLNIGPDAPLYKTRKGELKELPGAAAAFKVEDQVEGIDAALQSLDALQKHIEKHGPVAGAGIGGGYFNPETLGERESIQSQALFSIGIPQVAGALQAHEQAQIERQIQTAIVDFGNMGAIAGGKERALAALGEVKKTLDSKKKLALKKAQSLTSQGAPEDDLTPEEEAELQDLIRNSGG